MFSELKGKNILMVLFREMNNREKEKKRVREKRERERGRENCHVS